MSAFSLSGLPRIEFGCGVFKKIPSLVRQYGQRVLIVTGSASYQTLPQWAWLLDAFKANNITLEHRKVTNEPSPAIVDDIVADLRASKIDVVLGLGGGSALDAAKAIAGLLKIENSVMDFLEGVGPELDYKGPSVPFIAVPTTAGTGSETTKNAVLSVQGKNGYKKSFRHEKLVAVCALIDPDLLITCTPAMIAANGMDAFTQLLESFVSTKANPFTDSLAWSGLKAARDSLLDWYDEPDDSAQARDDMAYAAMLSGICLAQTGLGSVHGLASPLGSLHPVPHGVACGTMLAEATRTNILAMRAREPDNIALQKYAQVGRLMLNQAQLPNDAAQQVLVEAIEQWALRMRLPLLNGYGITIDDIDAIVANARGNSMKTNPIVLTDAELRALLITRL